MGAASCGVECRAKKKLYKGGQGQLLKGASAREGGRGGARTVRELPGICVYKTAAPHCEGLDGSKIGLTVISVRHLGRPGRPGRLGRPGRHFEPH